MFVKLAVLACVAVCAFAQHWGAPAAPAPAQYPAGVSPHTCPNYPLCSNGPAPAPAWNGGHNGQWNGGNNGQWNGGNNGQWNGGWNGGEDDGSWRPGHAYDNGEYTGDGDYHGEGLAEAGTYADVSQNWNNNGGWNGGHGGWNGGHGGWAH